MRSVHSRSASRTDASSWADGGYSRARVRPTDETLFEEMKRYARFGPSDSAALARFATVAAPHFERITAEFYERVREHEDAHAVFRDEAQITRLRRSLVAWMERLFAGPHDEAYFAERAKIGRVHVRIGLPQRYMFTAMSLIRASLDALAASLPEPDRAATRLALARILDLELAIMLETYRDDLVERMQRPGREERQRLASQLAQSEHRYANAVEFASVLVVGVDADARITLFNRAAEQLSGLAREEALGQSFAALLLPEDVRAREGARLARMAAGSESAPEWWEVDLETRAGKQRLVRWRLTYSPSRDDVGVVLFAIGHDVTDEHALAERTLRSEKLASVGTMAAGLAHEIRNPLNGALLHVTFLERALRRGGADGDVQEAVTLVGDEIRRLSTLVKDFLVFARPNPPQRRPSSLHAVCERVLAMAGPDASVVGARLERDFAAEDPVAAIDPEKIEQALLNLVRNAVDAVAAVGGGRVVLRTRRAPRTVLVEVEDEGPGLPAPDAPIFDAFYSTKPHGTGLGLAIVHRVVSDHEGTVDVESRPGHTVFRVTLRRVTEFDEGRSA
jgi:PAS domain S-box-containing protein